MNSKHAFSAAAALVASFALVAGAVSPAVAATNDPARKQEAQQSQAAPSAKADKKRYCVEDKFTGSRITKRKCMTRSEWIAQTGSDPVQDQ